MRAAYSVCGIISYFSCSKTPKLEQITALNLSVLLKLVRMGANADKIRQSATFRHVQQRQVSYGAKK